jgi:hypothetical protein
MLWKTHENDRIGTRIRKKERNAMPSLRQCQEKTNKKDICIHTLDAPSALEDGHAREPGTGGVWLRDKIQGK